MSADGRYVLFQSAASNLVEGDGNNTQDVFVRDLERGAHGEERLQLQFVVNGDEPGEVAATFRLDVVPVNDPPVLSVTDATIHYGDDWTTAAVVVDPDDGDVSS